MGRLDVAQGTVYEIAQWYPRMYVYDEVNGWNTLPYLGQGEFDVAMTRDADQFVSLEARVAAAQNAGADLFVSLHADAIAQGVAEAASDASSASV